MEQKVSLILILRDWCGLKRNSAYNSMNQSYTYFPPRSTGANSLCVIAPWEISRLDPTEAGSAEGMVNWRRRVYYSAVVWSWYLKGWFEARYQDQM